MHYVCTIYDISSPLCIALALRPHIYCNLLSKPVRKGRHNTFHIDGKMKQQLMMTEETDNYGLTYRRTHGDDGGPQWDKNTKKVQIREATLFAS